MIFDTYVYQHVTLDTLFKPICRFPLDIVYLFAGDLTMEKVKVSRYVTGKRPEFAPESDSEEDDEPFELQKKLVTSETVQEDETDVIDRRLRRIRERKIADSDDDDDDDDR